MNDAELISLAKSLVHPRPLRREGMEACTVGSALLSGEGNVYTGVCVDLSCGIGFCAEHAAVAEMLKGGETEILVIVAASSDQILTPCGRCRELFAQVDQRNLDARILTDDGSSVLLRELLPMHWLGSD